MQVLCMCWGGGARAAIERFTSSWRQPQQWDEQLTVYCRLALAGHLHGKGHSELVGCSHITLPLPPEKRTWVLKHAGK